MHKALVRVTSSSSVYAIDAFVHRTMSIVIVRPSVCAVCLPNRYSLFFLFRRLLPLPSPLRPERKMYFYAFMKGAAPSSPLSSSSFCSFLVPEVFVSARDSEKGGGSRRTSPLSSLLLSFYSTKGELSSISSWSRTLLFRLVYNRTVYIYIYIWILWEGKDRF